MPAATTGQPAAPDWIEPMLATLTQDRFSDSGWIFERKLDGERCLAFRDGTGVRLLTRNRKPADTVYPEIAAALKRQRARRFVVDGEVVSFSGSETSFAQLQQRIHVSHPSQALAASFPVFYYLFDVLWVDGTDTRRRPQRERKELLRGLLSFADPLRYTEHRDTQGEEYYHQACRQGWEGVIAKRAAAAYQAGRSRDWLKFKCVAEQEFVIGGYTDPQGTRLGIGALLLGYYDGEGRLTYAGKVGTGFDTRTLRMLRAELSVIERPRPAFGRGALPRTRVHWVEPRMVAQIVFSEWTPGGQLRHPRFQGLRRDKNPAEVVREVAASAGPGR